MQLQALLRECAELPPCGPDLEYDPAFQELELAARGKPEQRMGDRVIEAVPPDWARVKRLAEELFSRTKDVRVANLLARALVRLDGMQGLLDAIELERAMLERYWDHVHPQPDGDGRDLTMRLNALASLADPDTMLAEVRQATVAEVPRKGRVTVRDVLLAVGKLKPRADEQVRPLRAVEGLLQEAARLDPARVAAARDAAQAVHTLHDLLVDKIGPAAATELRPLLELMESLSMVCGQVLCPPQPEAATDSTAPSDADMHATAMPAGLTARPTVARASVQAATAHAAGPLQSREDAVRLLDQVCEFIERAEPANPAPLLIRRAQRLMTKNFVQIIEELAPDSLQGIRALAGIREDSG